MSRRIAVLVTTLLLTAAVPASSQAAGRPPATPVLLGEATLPSGLQFDGTTVGGLSGTAYDAENGLYYALSDDRSQFAPARFYTLRIDLADGDLQQDDVTVVDVTTLLGVDGLPFPAFSLDPEGLALTDDRRLVVVSEGDAVRGIAPFVREFALDGRQLRAFEVPGYYAPTATTGIRNNLAFESAGLTPSGKDVFTATENALRQDGPAATTTTGSPSRILRLDVRTGRLEAEYVYRVEPVRDAPVPAGSFSTNGLVELLPLGPTRLLALERGFSVGVGNTVQLYVIDTAGATDVSGNSPLPAGAKPVRKELLLDLSTLGLTLDNLEALVLGPVLPDGRQSLLITSDDNFSATQVTQVLAFALPRPGRG